MRQISNKDYTLALRLLYELSQTKGQTIREKENARKAYILHRKLTKNDGNRNTRQPGDHTG